MRKVTCKNNLGTELVFGEDAFRPFLLAHIDGLYGSENNVYMSENTMTDGGTHQGSTKAVRNIVLYVMDKAANVYNLRNRDILYSAFPKDMRGELLFEEDGVVRKTEYVVEYTRPVGHGTRYFAISLKCEDPYFYEEEDVSVWMASWKAGFTFPHIFKLEPFGSRSAEKSQNIINDTGADEIGLTIRITVNGEVTNPSVTRIESDTTIKIGSDTKPFTMNTGDILTITTGRNNKHIFLERNGTKTKVDEYLTEESDFFQIRRGNNNIGYSAAAGESNMVVQLIYRLRYEGT